MYFLSSRIGTLVPVCFDNTDSEATVNCIFTKKHLFVISNKLLVLNDILYEYILSVVSGYPEVMECPGDMTLQDFLPGQCMQLQPRFRRRGVNGTAACKIPLNCADSYTAPSFGRAGQTCRR